MNGWMRTSSGLIESQQTRSVTMGMNQCCKRDGKEKKERESSNIVGSRLAISMLYAGEPAK
jgi:hypothetical protein